jgi:adenine-specific DNA methylase
MTHTPFMETQFPLALLSAESYKERKAGSGQTLTGLGKWWGRKPLILVRAVIVGLLMPASSDPAKDQEVFLRILTMVFSVKQNSRKLSCRCPENITGNSRILSPANCR